MEKHGERILRFQEQVPPRLLRFVRETVDSGGSAHSKLPLLYERLGAFTKRTMGSAIPAEWELDHLYIASTTPTPADGKPRNSSADMAARDVIRAHVNDLLTAAWAAQRAAKDNAPAQAGGKSRKGNKLMPEKNHQTHTQYNDPQNQTPLDQGLQ